MDEFEQRLETFSTTKYGFEMRESLGYCFRFIHDKLEGEINPKIKDIEKRVKVLEGGAQNGVVE